MMRHDITVYYHKLKQSEAPSTPQDSLASSSRDMKTAYLSGVEIGCSSISDLRSSSLVFEQTPLHSSTTCIITLSAKLRALCAFSIPNKTFIRRHLTYQGKTKICLLRVERPVLSRGVAVLDLVVELLCLRNSR